jgi:hypothetical protein
LNARNPFVAALNARVLRAFGDNCNNILLLRAFGKPLHRFVRCEKAFPTTGCRAEGFQNAARMRR